MDSVVPAKNCPHYITPAFIASSGQDEKCQGCSATPVVRYGQYGKSGPTSRQRTLKDPAGKGYLRRKPAA